MSATLHCKRALRELADYDRSRDLYCLVWVETTRRSLRLLLLRPVSELIRSKRSLPWKVDLTWEELRQDSTLVVVSPVESSSKEMSTYRCSTALSTSCRSPSITNS